MDVMMMAIPLAFAKERWMGASSSFHVPCLSALVGGSSLQVSRHRALRPWLAEASFPGPCSGGSTGYYRHGDGDAACLRHGDADWSPEHCRLLDSLFERPSLGKKMQRQRRNGIKPRLLLSPPLSTSLLSLPRPGRLLARKPSDKSFRHNRISAKDSSFLKKLASEIHALSPGVDACTRLHGYAGMLRRGSLSATIRELGHMDDPGKALRLFLWQQRYHHLWPDDRTFCATLEVLAEAGDERNVWKLLDSLPLDTPGLAFESTILGFLKGRRFKQALHVKEAAQRAGHVLDHRVYARLIYVASHDADGSKLAMELLDELGSFPELKLKLEDCTTIMSACNTIGQYGAVERVYEWWKSSGYHPNVVMFTVLMKARANAGNHWSALAVYGEMEELGCAADLPAFRALLQSCRETGGTHMAFRLFRQMKDSGLPVTRDGYDSLIKLCLKDGMLGKAQGLLQEMQRLGLPINTEIKAMLSSQKISPPF